MLHMKKCFKLVLPVLRVTARAQRPVVGVNLSGGGAKGLAQAEILQAIDSAGLQVIVLTGTNMGGMVGALYAVG